MVVGAAEHRAEGCILFVKCNRFLNASFIREHFVCTRALLLRSDCHSLSRGTSQARNTVVIQLSHFLISKTNANKFD